MGANQLVVLNVYDMVSAAPGDRRRPALSGVRTPARCFLPRAPASSLVFARLLEVSQSVRRRAWARVTSQPSAPLAVGPTPGRMSGVLSAKLRSLGDLPTATWPLSCSAPLCPAPAGPCLSPNAQGFQQLSSPSSLGSHSCDADASVSPKVNRSQYTLTSEASS